LPAIQVAAWGDSLTAGVGGAGVSYPTVLGQLIHATVFDGGEGGDTSTVIAARMLADPPSFGDVTIIWAGRNNYFDQAQVLADVASMVAALSTPKRFLILSVLNGSYGSWEAKGGQGYGEIIALNKALKAAYPHNFLDIRSLLVAQYDPSLPQDVIDHANDTPPTSLRSDVLHLNAAGYTFVGQQIFKAFHSSAFPWY
jgi:lysophospholipase L1-like esterase